ncbi:YceI family protein [Kangiella sediminilitoris]|uniref:Lipid/polyisoprenoid-binding YceI-like domain-containing protein n=1 Tax=Kangiella sediminilitoris TaxID=1144748 RepID=A0A1B3BDD9_9GAMM|nr:YceI family protein [Kangiella sediminilitoris]AOE50795.1 hypothetical protein KS2013_2090 [Kangiella sediminilitoris]
MLHKILIGSLLSMAGLAAQAGWVVNPEWSEINFISIKNDTVGESHQFRSFDGNLSESGKLELTIDLNSVDTQIDIRDQRMKKHLFKTEQYPTATVTADIAPEFLEGLEGTSPVKYPLQATLSLGESSVTVETEVTVQPANDHMIRVTNSKPLLLSAKSLGLVEGINKLQEIAGLQSIDHVVPVTFDISLSKEKN